MALTVNPAVSGTRRNWSLSVLAFLAGAFFGALTSLLAMLVVVEALSALFSRHVAVAIAVAVIAWAVLHDLGLPLPLPYRSQQVPEGLRSVVSNSVVAAVFGFQLGIGFLTLFTYSTQLAMLVVLPFLPSLGAMIGAVAVFAAGKTIVLAAAAGAESTEDLVPRFQWSRRRMRLLRLTTASASVLIAAALVAAQ